MNQKISLLKLPKQYEQIVSRIEDDNIKRFFREFEFLYYSFGNIHDRNQITNFLHNYLIKYQFITYSNSKISQIIQSSSLNKNQQKISQKDTQNFSFTDFIICIEKQCLIIEQIEKPLIIQLFKDLKEHHISIIDTDINYNNDLTIEQQFLAEELFSIQDYFQKIIKINYFVKCTLNPIMTYIIHRHFYPRRYFKDQSFFTFKIQGYNSDENDHILRISDLIYSKSDPKQFNSKLQNIIEKVTNDTFSQTDNKSNTKDFEENEFIFIQKIYANNLASFNLAIHIDSLYIFMIKKQTNQTNEMRHEIEFCKKHSHRCFVPFYGFLKKKGQIIGLVYKYMSNGPLSTFLSKSSSKEVFNLLTINRLIQAVFYLHSNSLIHRDLKPSNILLDNEFIPFISDFETIRYLDDTDNESIELTNKVGSSYYISPEQNVGRKYSFSSDIFNLGQIIYFIYMKNDMLYEKLNIIESKEKYDRNIPLISNSPKTIQNIYLDCVKYKPNERPVITKIQSTFCDEIQSFEYFESFLLNDLNSFEMIQYIYESIIVQLQYKEKLDRFKKMLFSFKYLINIKEIGNSSILYFYLANLYSQGIGVAQNYVKSKKYYEKSANLNNSAAILNLGVLYQNGYGVKRDMLKAIEYYEKSSKLKNSTAMLYLGNIYAFGDDVDQDINKGYYYLNESAKLNNDEALCSLGILYLYGIGIAQDYGKAFEYFQLSSKLGNPLAQNNLGFLYFHGIFVNKDYNKAKDFFEMSAKKNCEYSFVNLASIYYNGFGVKKDYAKAKYYFEQLIKNNNSFGFLGLGELFEHGYGVEKNINEAIKYFKKAAEMNNSIAYVRLGYYYFKGIGYKQNYSKSKEYFEIAAYLGNSDALFNLSLIYIFSLGCDQNVEEGLNILIHLSKMNNPSSLNTLGYFYLKGTFVKKNYELARNYFERAAHLCCLDSYVNLSQIYMMGFGVDRNISKAKEYLEIAANFNHSIAQVKLGLIYITGLLGKPDYLKAKEYFELSAKQDNDEALYSLGYIYLHGLNTPKDYLKALHYFELSANQNNSNAMNTLGTIYYTGLKGIEKDYSKSIQYLKKSADLNNSEGIYNLGVFYFKKGDYSNAKHYFELAAYYEHNSAYLYLAIMYENGYGVELNKNKALNYYRLAANYNNYYAMYLLGCFYIDGDFFNKNVSKAIHYFSKCTEGETYQKYINMTMPDNPNVKINIIDESFYQEYNYLRYHAFNDLGLVYLLIQNDLHKAELNLKDSAFGEYPYGQNNYALFCQFYLNNIDEAKYMFIKASKSNFSLSFYNLAYLFEIKNNLNESIEFYSIFSNFSDENIFFHNICYDDKRLKVSKYFIQCFTDFKLAKYHFSLKNFNTSKNFFNQAFLRIFTVSKKLNFEYKFEFVLSNDDFSYLRNFVLEFPFFYLRNQTNFDLDSIISKSCCKMSDFEIQSKNIQFHNNVFLVFNSPNDVFEFVIKNDGFQQFFISEIEFIISIMNNILYTPPYQFLFGRVNIEKHEHNQEINNLSKNINEYFYEGFGKD